MIDLALKELVTLASFVGHSRDGNYFDINSIENDYRFKYFCCLDRIIKEKKTLKNILKIDYFLPVNLHFNAQTTAR